MVGESVVLLVIFRVLVFICVIWEVFGDFERGVVRFGFCCSEVGLSVLF